MAEQDAGGAAPYRVAFKVNNDWGAGFTGEISITNDGATPLTGWRLEFDAPFAITNLWNGQIAGHAGTRYVVDNAHYNGTVAPGATVTFGFQAGPLIDGPSGFVLNGVPLDGGGGGGEPEPLPTLSIADVAVPEGAEGDTTPARFAVTLSEAGDQTVTVAYEVRGVSATAGEDFVAGSGQVQLPPGEAQAGIVVDVLGDDEVEPDEAFEVVLSNPANAEIADGVALGTITNDDQPPPPPPPPPPPQPEVSVGDGRLIQTGGGGAAAGFLGTRGNQIVDSAGDPVKIAGVNWFGLETTNLAPHGLWARGYQEMMDQMADLGFNAIRLPFASALLDPGGGGTPNGIDFSKNPDLQGLSGLEIMDRIIDYAGTIGLRVILDNHRLDAGNGAEGSGLWYGGGRSEQDWIDDWTTLAGRYAGNPTVIGADLFNEPHGPATWGDGGATDWARAATAAGNAVHAVNPDWLIFVEGIGAYQGDDYWWGGHLGGVRDHPIQLDRPGKLVYAPHAYPNSVFAQPWFGDPAYPDNLPAKWTDTWGYIYQNDIAPVLLGEFGSKFEDPKDVQWMNEMFAYLGGDLNGDGASDLGPGELGMSWTWWSWNPNSGDTGGILRDDWQTVHEIKVDGLEPLMFDFGDDGGAVASAMRFEVALSAAGDAVVTVEYRTEDGTAAAGEDYEATSGVLTFQPGQTAQTVTVPVEPGGDGSFRLLLFDPVNATLGDGEAIGVISGGGSGGGDGGGPVDDPTVPDDGIVLDLTVRDDWDTGFVADMTVTNNTGQPLDGWGLLLEMPNDIVNIWDAQIAEDRGDAYVIRNASWNGTIAPGASAALGFQGTGDIDLGAVDYAVLA